MTKYLNASFPLVGRLFGALARGGRAFRFEQLMPSILYDNEARLGDLGLTTEDIAEAQRQRRSRGR